MNIETKIEALKRIAEAVHNGRYKEYSGRGMYGKYCASVYCDDGYEVIELAAQAGVTGARTDSMGRGYVVYWPSIPIKDE